MTATVMLLLMRPFVNCQPTCPAPCPLLLRPRPCTQAFMGTGSICPFLVLRVRRGPYLLSDTLLQINGAKNDGSLKKPLKVGKSH